jgi:hypothetical protein
MRASVAVPADWLALLCSALELVEPGLLVDSVYDTRDVAVKFQRDSDKFTGYARLKDDPRGGGVGGVQYREWAQGLPG